MEVDQLQKTVISEPTYIHCQLITVRTSYRNHSTCLCDLMIENRPFKMTTRSIEGKGKQLIQLTHHSLDMGHKIELTS